MVAITKLFLFATAATAALISRRSPSILNDLKAIDSDTKALTASVNAYNGGITNAILIQDAYVTLDTKIINSTVDAKSVGTATPAQSQAIIDYINTTLELDVKASITALVAKKANFQADGLSGLVLGNLKTLKINNDALGAALLKRAPTSKKSAAQAAQAKIDFDIQRGINAFS